MSYLGYCPEVSAVRVPWFRCVRCPFGPLREGPTSRRARTCLWTRLCNTPASAHRRSSWPCPGSVWKKATQVLTLDYCASYPEQTKLIQGNTAKAGKPKRKLFFYFLIFLQAQLSRWLWCCSTATAREVLCLTSDASYYDFPNRYVKQASVLLTALRTTIWRKHVRWKNTSTDFLERHRMRVIFF